MEGLIVALREGIEAALVVGILLAYLGKTGKTQLNKFVYAGLLSAVAASLIGALVLNLVGIDPESEVVEGIFFFTAGIFVASMVVWMWRTGRFISQRVGTRLDSLTTDQRSHTTQGVGLFAFTFLMVFREGIETVLFLTALSFASASQLLTTAGAILGLTLAATFGILFIKGSLKIDLKRFFEVTGLVLIILVVKLLASGIHEWTEVGILPVLNKLELDIIGFIVRDSSDIAIVIGLLVLPGVLIISSYFKREPAEIASLESPVESRKRRAKELRQKRWALAGFGSILVIVFTLSSALALTSQISDPLPTAVSPRDGQIKIPITSLKSKELTKFSYESGGVQVKFLLVKRGEKDIGSGLDACQVCGPYGYSQDLRDLDNIICKNCNAPIPLPTIGEPGGCNPMALPIKVIGDRIVIEAQELAKARKVFSVAPDR